MVSWITAFGNIACLWLMRISQFAIFGLVVSYQANLCNVSLFKICGPSTLTEPVEDDVLGCPALTVIVNELD